MRRLILTFFTVFVAIGSFAQFGNEWITFNQQYYKIPVAKDGLYRLTYTDLQNAGFPVGSIDPRRIQIFHRGVEQHIRVEGEIDAVFNPADYIEFYGKKNDGVSDAELYQPASTQPNQYYNLYSDTTAYFITVNSLAQLGFRMENFFENNLPPISAETFHHDQKLRVLTTQYSTGQIYNTYLQNSFFETGEGWTGDLIVQNSSLDYLIDNILFASQVSGNPQLEVQVVGRAELPHRVEISVGPSSASRVVATQTFSGSEVITISATLNWSDIGADGRMTVRVRALGVSGADRLSASYVKVTYPQIFNQAGSSEKIFQLNEKAGNRSYIEIQNTVAGTKLFDITDPSNVVFIGTTSTTTLNAVIPNTATSRKILATNSFITPSVRPVSFRNIDPSVADYLIISNQALMKPAGEYSNAVKAYASYRASSAGGSYDTLLVDVNQLYNQFNYGEISPLAITRFMKWTVSSGNPRYLFIIGKGLDVWHGYHRNPSAFTFHDYVPSAGMPASDILYTAGLNGTNVEPAIPTGRIASNTPQDVAAYLNKVKEMEALPFHELWRKELLHLSGGINPGEPELFKNILGEYAKVAEDFYLGGNVSVIAKENTEVGEIVNISDKVNAGLNLITLFGHSSPSQNDFNIGFVSAPELGYNNAGKYPMFLINGCNAGDFFSPVIRYGEDWINTPLKGAVGFMANTSFGYASLLNSYSATFYNIAYGDSVFIHKGIGDVQKEVVRRLTEFNTSVSFVTQGQQMILLGDPAVKLFGSNKPDFEITNNDVYAESYNSDPVTALSDSFAIKMIVRNFGRAKEDSLAIRIVRTFNDNTSTTYDSIYYTVLYRDTLEFTIYKEDKGFGINTFSITLDPLNEINEIDKSNNTAELNVFIPLNAARNLYPQGFAIVNTASVKLTVQSTDILDNARDFIIQIDTVDTFTSQYVQEFTINGKIVTKEINLPASVDTLAFYWRSRLAQPLTDESSEWSTSSFTYIKDGPEGWAQVHFPQYLSNTSVGLVKDSEARLLRLQETVSDVSIQTFGANHPASHTAVSVKLNQTEYNPVSLPEVQCRDNTINLIVFDKTTTVPYISIPVQYPDKKACGRRPEVITSFLSTETEVGDGKDLMQLISSIAVGDSVVLFSIGNPGYVLWSANVKNKLGELGISLGQISALQPGEPVIIFAKKGSAVGSAAIIKTALSPPDIQELKADGTITGRFTSGTMTTSTIGPAVDWQQVFTKARLSEVTDQFSFDVIGITLEGNETIIKNGFANSPEDISDIDADQYPYLKLVFQTTDDINLTAPQLEKWLVTYTPAAEGVLFFDGSTETQNLKEGEILTNTYRFKNISPKEFNDSLTVQYNIFNTTARTSDPGNRKIKAPAPGQETSFDISIDTKEKPGLNDVRVYVNPRILPELYYDNNVLELKNYLNVERDIFNPVLDITIDGRYITNGDFVSSNPEIVLTVWDENPLLLNTDTTGIKMFLKFPCDQCDYTPIYFSRTDVEWFAATQSSSFRMEFKPQNLPVGIYDLLAEATDASGNKNDSSYNISFVVSSDNSTSIQGPYPNPSSSTFFFNIVITGDDRPDIMHMEVINTSGQIVQEIALSEFFTGTNTLIWDASHQPGGLYLYRIRLTQSGKETKTVVGKLMLVK